MSKEESSWLQLLFKLLSNQIKRIHSDFWVWMFYYYHMTGRRIYESSQLHGFTVYIYTTPRQPYICFEWCGYVNNWNYKISSILQTGHKTHTDVGEAAAVVSAVASELWNLTGRMPHIAWECLNWYDGCVRMWRDLTMPRIVCKLQPVDSCLT